MSIIDDFIDEKRKNQGEESANNTILYAVEGGFMLNLPCKDNEMYGEIFTTESRLKKMINDLNRLACGKAI